jgi:putative oxidoreductase
MSGVNRALSAWQPHVLSLFRLMVGLLFMEHGMTKLLGFPFDPHYAHLPPIEVFQAPIELIGGALVALGLFTRFAAFICSGDMAAAYFIAHFPRSFFPGLNGGDSSILYCFAFFYLVFAGGGPWSLDRLRRGG